MEQEDSLSDEETEAMLREYDALKKRLASLEPQLRAACAQYGRRRGYWGYRLEHLRLALGEAKRQSVEA